MNLIKSNDQSSVIIPEWYFAFQIWSVKLKSKFPTLIIWNYFKTVSCQEEKNQCFMCCDSLPPTK